MDAEVRLFILVVVSVALVFSLEKLGLKFPFSVFVGFGCILALAAFCQFVLGVTYA